MEHYPFSTLTAGPLSTSAQKVLAALKRQYADRIDRSRHMPSFSGEDLLSENQDIYNKSPEVHTQAHVSYVSSQSPVERVLRVTEPTLIKKPSHEQTLQFPEEIERQFLNYPPELELCSQPVGWPFQSGDNTFTQWEADKRADWRLWDHSNDNSHAVFKADNDNTVPVRCPAILAPQGKVRFPSNGFNWVNPQSVTDALGLQEALTESFNGGGNLPWPSGIAPEATSAAHPPIKRWCVGHKQTPMVTCLKQFDENNFEHQTEDGKLTGNQRFDKMQRKQGSQDAAAPLHQEKEQQPNVQVTTNVFAGFAEECSDKTFLYENVLKEKSQPLLYHNYLKASSPSKSSNISPADCLDQTIPYGNHLPSQKESRPETLGDNEREVKSGRQDCASHTADLCMSESDERNIQMTVEDNSMEQERCTSNVIERNLNPPTISQVDKNKPANEHVTKTIPPPKQPGMWVPPQSLQDTSRMPLSQQTCSEQTISNSHPSTVRPSTTVQKTPAIGPFLSPQKSAQGQEEVPMQTLSRANSKQESNMEILADIPIAYKLKHWLSEVDGQIHQDEHKEGDRTSETTRPTLALISDPRVCDTNILSEEEKVCVLEEAVRARALVATMVYQDGTTQLDAEQKCPPAVCGVLVLLKKSLDSVSLEETEAAKERLLFLRLEQRPVWAQQDHQQNQDLFVREIFLQMVCGTRTLVCYKAKDLLRTALRHFKKDLTWKQVACCKLLDPQIAAWLLDPADSAICFQSLFNKYCTRPTRPTPLQSALGIKKVTHVISSLSQLHRVMVELRNRLETRGLWKLYFCMEQKMIPILAAMESHRIHVDKEALKKMSEMLGTKVKQLEQEAHQAAGQQFLVSSSSQLRMILFEKLRLQDKCKNKKLPKTVFKQQQSTSEDALLKLQHLHPLPKIILEYRQIHKIKSTFVDGILSCVTKTFISSTWNQTSTVSGRLSAKQPNFQALPKQPVQITEKQSGQGKEVELVTVHPRTMFIPREGWTFLSADFCQVELRLLAYLSSDPELMRIFQNPEADVFTMLASQWKGVSEDTVSSEDREHAKRIVYSVIYGAGKERLSAILGVSAKEASRFQDTFLQTYKEVQAFIQHTIQYCHKHGYVKSIMGRRRSLPNVHSPEWGIRTQAERQAVNFVVQGSAADLCKMAMIQICSHVSSSTTLTARLVAQIHDELLFEVEDSQVEDFAVLVKNTMESLQLIDCLGVSLTVPLKVSVCKGRSWGSMCEVNVPHAGAAHTSA